MKTNVGEWKVWSVKVLDPETEKKIGKNQYRIGRINKGTLEWYEDSVYKESPKEPPLTFTRKTEANSFLKEIKAIEKHVKS